MVDFDYELSLRVTHPTWPSDDICKMLNMTAGRMWTVGEQRTNPVGTFLSGINKETYCSFPLESPEGMQLAESLRHWNQQFLLLKDTFNKIHSSGGRIEYFIGWFCDGNSGEIFNLLLLKELVELKIELSFDVYGSLIPSTRESKKIINNRKSNTVINKVKVRKIPKSDKRKEKRVCE